MTDDPLPGATRGGRVAGLESWSDPVSFDITFWVAPPGTAARLEVTGDGRDAPELLWSLRCAEIPDTRAVVVLVGPGFGDVSADFENAHHVAEEVAEHLSDGTAEVGPIEVLVFRPDPGDDGAGWPLPVQTAGGAEFRFRHRGGADVHLTLTLPSTPGEA